MYIFIYKAAILGTAHMLQKVLTWDVTLHVAQIVNTE